MANQNDFHKILLGDGLKISDEKVKAVVSTTPLKDASQVHSFFVIAQFCTKFVPPITFPLTRRNGVGRWKVKEHLTQSKKH